MPEVKWIRITTDMFDDEKIKLLEAMPDADTLLIIWVKLICQAGKVNANGYIFLAEDLPYTEEQLATIFNRPVNTVKLALRAFEQLQMISIDETGTIVLPNFSKHQNIEGLEKIRENTRSRVAQYRERLQLVGGESYREHSSMVMARDDYRCVYCGSEENLVIDHLIPLLLGGDNEPDNLVTACRKCNSGKAGKLFEDTGYHFINPETNDQYLKVKARLKVTNIVTVTSRNPLEKSRVDKKKNKSNNNTYGEFTNVLLSGNEYKKLVERFGEEAAKEKIETLSAGIESKGYKYRSHYATILSWDKRDRKESQNGTHRGNTKVPKSYPEPPPDPELEAMVEADKRSRAQSRPG